MRTDSLFRQFHIKGKVCGIYSTIPWILLAGIFKNLIDFLCYGKGKFNCKKEYYPAELLAPCSQCSSLEKVSDLLWLSHFGILFYVYHERVVVGTGLSLALVGGGGGPSPLVVSPHYCCVLLLSSCCHAVVIVTSFRPMPTARRSLRSAVPPAWVTARQGQAPWTPRYTSLIPISVHMFHPNPQVYFLF